MLVGDKDVDVDPLPAIADQLEIPTVDLAAVCAAVAARFQIRTKFQHITRPDCKVEIGVRPGLLAE
jgi:hypothetical protein